jgi:hypothetical protein
VKKSIFLGLFFISVCSLLTFAQSGSIQSFVAIPGQTDITLTWGINPPANCGTISIEYSNDSTFYFPVVIYTDNIPSSTEALTFQYTHTGADKKVKNYYRLNAGSCGSSQIISAGVGNSLNYKLYPNPLREGEPCTVIFENPRGCICRVYIFDRNGQLVRKDEPFQGNTVQFYRNGIPAGLYYFVISDLNDVYVGGKFYITDF